jgi:non-heme chloroperoxidase
MKLEILSRPARGDSAPASRAPLLFVHGAYVGAWCWEEHFLDWFAERGYAAHALSLRGHGGSEGRDRLDQFGLADYAEDVARAVAGLPRPPVLVGHSMGALVAQKCLERVRGIPALVLACPVPSYGLLPSSFSLALTRPSLFAGLNDVASGAGASPEVLAQALFADPPVDGKLARCYRGMQRESRRALMDMSGWGLPLPWLVRRPPTLVLGAERDALFTPAEAQGSARVLGAEFRMLPGLGHAVMLDGGWERAAQAIADWLEAREGEPGAR